MKELHRHTIIKNELGLHARAAVKIAELTRHAKSTVWIIKDGETVDASDVLDILSLECAKESKITLKIEDQSDIHILNAITDLIESGFGE